MTNEKEEKIKNLILDAYNDIENSCYNCHYNSIGGPICDTCEQYTWEDENDLGEIVTGYHHPSFVPSKEAIVENIAYNIMLNLPKIMEANQ